MVTLPPLGIGATWDGVDHHIRLFISDRRTIETIVMRLVCEFLFGFLFRTFGLQTTEVYLYYPLPDVCAHQGDMLLMSIFVRDTISFVQFFSFGWNYSMTRHVWCKTECNRVITVVFRTVYHILFVYHYWAFIAVRHETVRNGCCVWIIERATLLAVDTGKPILSRFHFSVELSKSM